MARNRKEGKEFTIPTAPSSKTYESLLSDEFSVEDGGGIKTSVSQGQMSSPRVYRQPNPVSELVEDRIEDLIDSPDFEPKVGTSDVVDHPPVEEVADSPESSPVVEAAKNTTDSFEPSPGVDAVESTTDSAEQEPEPESAPEPAPDPELEKDSKKTTKNAADSTEESARLLKKKIAAGKTPDASEFARFKEVYSSKDGQLAVFEDADGHLVAVDASKLA